MDIFDESWTIARFQNGRRCEQCIESIVSLHLEGVEVERVRATSMRFRAPGGVECGIHSVVGEHAGQIMPRLVLR